MHRLVYEKLQSVEGIERNQNTRTLDDPLDAESAERRKPEKNDRAEKNSHFSGAMALDHEQSDNDS